MAHELISKASRNAFRELLVGWTLREIDLVFEAAGVACDESYEPPVSGQRRGRVEQYYQTIDFSSHRDVAKLLRAFEEVIDILHQHSGSDQSGVTATIDGLVRRLTHDGYEYVNGRFRTTSSLPILAHARLHATSFDLRELRLQVERIDGAIESDPALAIGTARELVETTCKTILQECGETPSGTPDLPQLVKATLTHLKLVPDAIPDEAKGADVIKRMLMNLATVAQGLAELRNLYGTGHGRAGRVRGLSSRHAKLAVGAATALATFLFETHLERIKEGAMP